MTRRYRLYLEIDDEIDADDIDEAWETITTRVEDRFYGPTVKNIEDLGEIPEEEVP